jgi:glycyl-tRNA synthetase beta chain
MPASKQEALGKFLATPDGGKFADAIRHVADTLSAGQEKDGPRAYSHRHAPNLRIEHQEHKLAAAVARAREETAEKLAKKDFSGAFRSLAKLHAPLEDFRRHVPIEVDNPDLRLNRLRLLAEARRVVTGVADLNGATRTTGDVA